MKYAFYPGCVSRGGCPELYPTAVKVAQTLGIELEEMKDVGCTGAGVLSKDVSDPINARTFAKAEAKGLPILTICSTCQGVMSQANARLKDPEYRDGINKKFLNDEGLEYEGTATPKHLLWVLFEDYGIEQFKPFVKRPLKGLRVAPFYGCYLRRPSDIIAPKEFAGRKTYLEELIEIVGAETVDFSGKGKSCGFPIFTANERASLAMAGNHTSEAKEKGADCMVTPCPLCHLSLDGNQAKAEAQKGKKIDLPILHLPQFLGLAMGFSTDEMDLKRHMVPTQAVESKVNMLA
jgi:succinate dehydrogenase / fumarate reductase cytochrome b subunit